MVDRLSLCLRNLSAKKTTNWESWVGQGKFTPQPFSSPFRQVTKHFSWFKITTWYVKSKLLPVDGFSSVAIGENSADLRKCTNEQKIWGKCARHVRRSLISIHANLHVIILLPIRNQEPTIISRHNRKDNRTSNHFPRFQMQIYTDQSAIFEITLVFRVLSDISLIVQFMDSFCEAIACSRCSKLDCLRYFLSKRDVKVLQGTETSKTISYCWRIMTSDESGLTHACGVFACIRADGVSPDEVDVASIISLGLVSLQHR